MQPRKPRPVENKLHPDAHLKKLIEESVRESVRIAFEEAHSMEDEDMDDSNYTPPKTMGFRGGNVEDISATINEWVVETGNDIENIALISGTDGQGNRYVEAIVIYYGEDMDFEPPPNWLSDFSEE